MSLPDELIEAASWHETEVERAVAAERARARAVIEALREWVPMEGSDIDARLRDALAAYEAGDQIAQPSTALYGRGWWVPSAHGNARAHYSDTTNRSLCGNHRSDGVPAESFNADTGESPPNACAGCDRRAAQLRSIDAAGNPLPTPQPAPACSNCGGTGAFWSGPCTTCDGSGVGEEPQPDVAPKSEYGDDMSAMV